MPFIVSKSIRPAQPYMRFTGLLLFKRLGVNIWEDL